MEDLSPCLDLSTCEVMPSGHSSALFSSQAPSPGISKGRRERGGGMLCIDSPTKEPDLCAKSRATQISFTPGQSCQSPKGTKTKSDCFTNNSLTASDTSPVASLSLFWAYPRLIGFYRASYKDSPTQRKNFPAKGTFIVVAVVRSLCKVARSRSSNREVCTASDAMTLPGAR